MTHVARITVVLVLAAFAGLCTVHGAQAATRTASISVSAEVVDSCSVTVSRMADAGSAQCRLATTARVVTSAEAVDASANSDATVSTNSDQADGQNAAKGAQIMTFIF